MIHTSWRSSRPLPHVRRLVIDALIEAAEAGKQVLALVEIKARFDEQANIAWARGSSSTAVTWCMAARAEDPCKLSMVVRDEPDGLRRYAHRNGQLQPQDRAAVRGHRAAHRQPDRHRRHRPVVQPSVGNGSGDPVQAAAGCPARYPQWADRPDQPRDRQPRGRQAAGIKIKVNSIVDEATSDALYRASRAGVPVDLWVRGTCTIRPGVPGLSENIRVRSILGRFLEHSRLFWFANDGSPSVGIGSADLMHRNLDRRVEVLVSITNPAHVGEIEELFRSRSTRARRRGSCSRMGPGFLRTPTVSPCWTCRST